MSEEINEGLDAGAGTLFDGLNAESGGGVLRDITAVVPQADPAVMRLRTADVSSGTPSSSTGGSGTLSTPENTGKKVIEADPKVYTYVQDHKGNPFDPEKHQVDAEGHPVFNARGRVKCLEPGQENPIRLIFNNLKSFVLPAEKERPQAECAAQAAVQSVESERMESAEICVDLYGGVGYVLRGAPFRKNWEKWRRQKLVNALVRYQRIKNIVIPVKAEWILIHAFATDLLTVEGEALFENKGGLLGILGRKGWNARARALAAEAEALAKKDVPHE